MKPSNNPLAEIFGFPPDNGSGIAEHFRRNRLCPYNNRVPSCTKDKAKDPLGVCTIYEDNRLAITCPVRFRQDWIVASDAASFFFPQGATWTSLTEVKLNDANGKSAGNIDIVLVAYNDHGQVIDFGALEIQAVYISGNIREPFQHYMQAPTANHSMSWHHGFNYPRPDYLSSSRKRLAPQLIFKGGILNEWQKKMAVALHTPFFETLPELTEVDPQIADIAWFLYDLELDNTQNRYFLRLNRVVYTLFKPSLQRITSPEPGLLDSFIELLQKKLDEKLENPPDAPTIQDLGEAR